MIRANDSRTEKEKMDEEIIEQAEARKTLLDKFGIKISEEFITELMKDVSDKR